MDTVSLIFCALVQVLVLYLFFLEGVALVSLVRGCKVLRRLSRSSTRDDSGVLLKSPLVPSVSAVAVPHDASPEAREFVRLLIALHYSVHEVVVVLDGPSPSEMEVWKEELRLIPSNRPPVRDRSAAPTAAVRAVYVSRDPIHLVVVEKERGGQADALNAGVYASEGSVIALFDPQSDFVPDALLRLIRPMLEDPQHTTAVCGVAPALYAGEGSGTPPGTRGDDLAGRFAALETVRMWLARCAAFFEWKMLLPVPGSTLLLRRQTILDAGGFTAGPMEMFMHLHGLARAAGKPDSIGFVPSISCLRQPRSLAGLRERVDSDQREIGRVYARRHTVALKGGAIGWGLPGLVSMRLIRPLVETIVLPLALIGWALGWIPFSLVGLVLLATIGAGIVLSMAAVVLRELAHFRGADPAQLTSLFLAAIPENLGYRQIRNLWLIGAFFRGMKAGKPVRA